MAEITAEGTTLSFSGTTTPLLEVGFSVSASAIDVSSIVDSTKKYEPGPLDTEFTATLLGHVTTALGSKGTCTITWGGPDAAKSIENCVLIGRETSGSLDDKITTSLTIKPSIADD